jgi:hypothetical protein
VWPHDPSTHNSRNPRVSTFKRIAQQIRKSIVEQTNLRGQPKEMLINPEGHL